MIVIRVYDPKEENPEPVLEINELMLYGVLGADYDVTGKSGSQLVVDCLGEGMARVYLEGNNVLMFDNGQPVDPRIMEDFKRVNNQFKLKTQIKQKSKKRKIDLWK